MPTDKQFKYFAFISYKSDDLSEAWKLKKKLDGYKLPTLLQKQYNMEKKPTYEAFLDKTNIQPGELTAELRNNLDNSHYLIVVCSPRSAKSEYVNAEIEWFTRNGREHEMYLLIIESDPSRIEDCFNPAIKAAEERWSKRDGEKREILGVNIKEKYVDKMFFLYRWPLVGTWLQQERAYMQLISKLLNLEFEQLWSYQRIELIEKFISWVIGLTIVIGTILYTAYINKDVEITTRLREVSYHNSQLPPMQDAIVTIFFDNKIEVDTIQTLESSTVFRNVPHRYLNKEVRIKVACRDYIDVDTTILLTKNVVLNIRRDTTIYGYIHFQFWDSNAEKPIGNTELEISGMKVTSDNEGYVFLSIPLESQQTRHYIKSSYQLENDTIHLPCGPNDIISTKIKC